MATIILQFINTRPIYYCGKFGGNCVNILWVIAIYIIFCWSELEPWLKCTEYIKYSSVVWSRRRPYWASVMCGYLKPRVVFNPWSRHEVNDATDHQWCDWLSTVSKFAPPPSSAEANWKVRKYPAEGFMNFPLWVKCMHADIVSILHHATCNLQERFQHKPCLDNKVLEER